MPVTLERLIKSIGRIELKAQNDIADKWLGAFEGVIPKGMTSTEYIKKLRESCYGKI